MSGIKPLRYRNRCVCDWPKARDAVKCNGTGVQHCAGCGGDQCVCVCGGERECPGCAACEIAAAAREGS